MSCCNQIIFIDPWVLGGGGGEFSVCELKSKNQLMRVLSIVTSFTGNLLVFSCRNTCGSLNNYSAVPIH